MKKILLMAAVIMIVAVHEPGLAENITVSGGMRSKINLSINKKVITFPGIQTLSLSFVAPEMFTSPTYRQDIQGFDLKFMPPPAEQTSQVDSRGNRIIRASWKSPPESIDINISLEASNITRLETINTSAPFPLTSIPADIVYYLKATSQVQADDVRVRNLAAELVKDVQTEFAAVQRIISFVVDYVQYTAVPEKQDAVYSLASRRGNCQNFSHLSAALMRASGIPVRIVNGITLNKPVSIDREGSMLTYKMGKGRHAWIEVWFPDLGWVPFDPQQTAMFVLNRFIRIETGADSNETVNDGRVSWSLTGVRQGDLKVQEVIHEDFADDEVVLKGRKEATGPKSYLLYPLMKADVKNQEVTLPLPSAAPSPATKAEVKTAEAAPPLSNQNEEGIFSNIRLAINNALKTTAEDSSTTPSRIEEMTRIAFKAEKGAVKEIPLPEEGFITLGNLEFPAEIDFAFPPAPVVIKGKNNFEKTKSFFVETAEFVTSLRTQYAQAFVIKKPLKLESIGLALHKFGGDGHLWIDVYRDDGNGQPGTIIATSDMVDLDHLSEKPGYRWTDFFFGGNKPVLATGKYWIALGFTGNPVVNWFYTYGKSVGPTEGTRYRGIYDKNWRGALNYEFNYRVAGVFVK